MSDRILSLNIKQQMEKNIPTSKFNGFYSAKVGGLFFIITVLAHLAEIRGVSSFLNATRSHSRLFMKESRPCVGSKRWGVITTIFEVNDAVRHFADTFEDAMCLVVVGDLKTNHSHWRDFESSKSNVMYLSPSDQGRLPFGIVERLPWNHFGRKNIGYMFAMAHNASFLYDFDDDNHLQIKSFSEVGRMEMHISENSNGHHVWNPYPYFQPRDPHGRDLFCWPRGQPLQFVNDEITYQHQQRKGNNSKTMELAIIQSLADHNPDVDAIYRMTRPLPVYFRRSHIIIVPPPKSFVPLNAQATIFREAGFFSLLLPTTVTGRVSDIWRGYIALRLLWETDLEVGFSSPFVSQYRNPHSYMDDFRLEADLYDKTDDLLELLAEARGHGTTLSERYLYIFTLLVKQGFLSQNDLDLAKAWIVDLESIGYTWPVIRKEYSAFHTHERNVVDERKSGSQSNLLVPLNSLDAPHSFLDEGKAMPHVFSGGVLPIRRFVITGGEEIATDGKEDDDGLQCNNRCWGNKACQAWQFDKGGCRLFADKEEEALDIFQADDNNPEFLVGFLQRNATVLRPESCNSHKNDNVSERVLYVLHFHHEVIPAAFTKIINEILPSSWLCMFDLAIITPREIDIVSAAGVEFEGGKTLRNPFRAKSLTSPRGANGHMSLPIARAKFPGYKGYLLVNDDAMLKTWNLPEDVWFGERPWGTFVPSQFGEQEWVRRQIKKRYPYGNQAGWSWYNYDSGSVLERKNLTRSNFDAALAALNEICSNEEITTFMDDALHKRFCLERAETIVRPLCNGKADIFYVPGNALGIEISKAMTIFGEHDVFMEIAFPMTYNLLVPGSSVLEMPYCDSTGRELMFQSYFQPTRKEGKSLTCPTLHPIKFGRASSIEYWKEIVSAECSWCTWKSDNRTFWKTFERIQFSF